MALTALCKALCLLLCKKLKIPSNAKPTKPEIIAPKFLFYFSGLWEISVILNLPNSLVYDVWFYYGIQFAFYRIPCMVLILHNKKANLLYFL